MSKIFSSISALLVAATCLFGCSSGQNNSAERDPEYMKIIGDLKWTDNISTLSKKFPDCNHINQYYEKFVDCSINIGGINMKIIGSDKTGDGGGDEFLNSLNLEIPSNEDTYLLKKILREKYLSEKTILDCSKVYYDEIICSKYTQYRFLSMSGRNRLFMKTRYPAELVLNQIRKGIYESTINMDKLDPSDF